MKMPFRHLFTGESAGGNVLITVVLVISILTMFGALMASRMIIDANATSKRLVTHRAFYLADGGIQWGRKRLAINTGNITLGPISIGGGTLTVSVQQTTIQNTSSLNDVNVYKITSTAVVGESTRQVEEIRYRGGGTDKDFMYWHETVVDEF